MTNRDTHNIFAKHKIAFSAIILIISIILMIIISEMALYILKYENTYSKMNRFSYDQADWWTNDSIFGPRYVQNQFSNFDSLHHTGYYERLKRVNKQGYHDKLDFVDLPSDTNSMKVLFLGDSYTWGASADLDSSFVNVFEQKFRKISPLIVWNAGIPATGTNYALHVAKRLLPLQKSNIVVLEFYPGNDFSDNLTPFDQIQFSSKASCIKCYKIDKNFNPVKISIQEAYKRATGAYPIENLNILQRKIIIKSRLIPLLNTVFEKFKKKYYQYTNGDKISREEYSYQITKTYLTQLKNYVLDNNAEFIVLLVPDKHDLNRKSRNYLKAIEILKDLEINFLEISNNLSQASYMQKVNDDHWNNSGHRIAGTLLYEYISKENKSNKLLTRH
jgi:hypothetical protein